MIREYQNNPNIRLSIQTNCRPMPAPNLKCPVYPATKVKFSASMADRAARCQAEKVRPTSKSQYNSPKIATVARKNSTERTRLRPQFVNQPEISVTVRSTLAGDDRI